MKAIRSDTNKYSRIGIFAWSAINIFAPIINPGKQIERSPLILICGSSPNSTYSIYYSPIGVLLILDLLIYSISIGINFSLRLVS
jgi:hypothetical protein